MNVISDMVGTVTTGSPVLGLVNWVRHHQSAFRANSYLARQMPSYFLAKWGLIDWVRWAQGLMISALPLIRNPSRDRLNQMGRWSVDYELWPKRRPDVLEQLASYLEDGGEVYIASSAYEPTVKAFASQIGAQGIGSPLEIAGGRARFAESIAAGQTKVEKVLNQLGVDRVDAAFGDTWADIPLLERAERPVAVYPDDRLRATALERGWEILEDRKKV